MIGAGFIASMTPHNRHRGQHLFLRMRIGILAAALVMDPTPMASIEILVPAGSSTAIIGRIPSALDVASR